MEHPVKSYIDEIRLRLDEKATEGRYSTDDPWYRATALEVAKGLTNDEMADLLVTKVKSEESRLIRKGNKFLKDYAEGGQEFFNEPGIANTILAIEETYEDEGEIKTRHLRVPLWNMNRTDFLEWADQEEKAANRDHAARLRAVASARDIYDTMFRMGWNTGREWLDSLGTE